jgi:hypothetical protein
MKKNYVLAAALMLGATTQAQVTVDFDSYALSSESLDNGSAGNGDFIFDELQFNNVYDTVWGSWDGFSISNVTDNTTPGWSNQYSAFPGAGSDSSENYAVAYRIPQIIGTTEYVQIYSMKITNATYAAISMRDGDTFGKQFGSPNDANGQPDGTNGEDFFKVWIIAEDYSGWQKDSIEFFLADYRFADSTLDYIVDSWVEVNLYDSLGFPPHSLSFRFESSDNGQFGMNTPAYFAVDEFVYAWPIGVDENSASLVRVYPNPVKDILMIEGEVGTVRVYDLNGQEFYESGHIQKSTIDFSNLSSGVYFVELTTNAGTSIQKVIK